MLVLIENGIIITMDPQRQIFGENEDKTGILIEDNKIIEIGNSHEIRKDFKPSKIIDASNKVVMPGMIDCHGHPLGLIRTLGDSQGGVLNKTGWRHMCYHIWNQLADEEYYKAEGLLTCIERIKFGTTCGVTQFNRTDDIIFASKNIEAVKESGIRGIVAAGPIIDNNFLSPEEITFIRWNNGKHYCNNVGWQEQLKNCEKIIKKYDRSANGKIRTFLGPIYLTQYSENVEELKEHAQESRRIADEYEVGIHTHQSGGEINFIHKKLGSNILGPDVSIAHGTGFTDEEIEILKKTDTKVVHCPSARMIFLKGNFRTVEMLDLGITIGLGTDASANDKNYDLFKEMKQAIFLQRMRFKSQYYMSPGKALEMATIDAAKAIGLESEIGSIEKGKKADIIIIDLEKPHLVPAYNIVSHVVYNATGSDVDTVIVDGEVIMENRNLVKVNEEDIIHQAKKQAEKIFVRGDLSRYLKSPIDYWGQTKWTSVPVKPKNLLDKK